MVQGESDASHELENFAIQLEYWVVYGWSIKFLKEITYFVPQYFEYVVVKQIPPIVCFGSSLQRKALATDIKHQSPFMRRLARECRDNLGPGAYDGEKSAFYDVTHRNYSKRGLGSKSARWKDKEEYQPPLKMPPKPIGFGGSVVEKIKQNCAPFNQTSKRKVLFRDLGYPSPCEYWPDYKKREMGFTFSFSGKKILKCPVPIKCVPYNLDACGVCGGSCSAQGDYWQFEDRLFLCRKHYDILFKNCLSRYQGVKLSEFKSVRDCFFMHAHNSCKAALKIMKNEEVVKKLRREAYLDLFFPQRRACTG